MKLYSPTNEYSNYNISDVEHELIKRIGPQVGIEPAFFISLGTGQTGLIYEDEDGTIVMHNTSTDRFICDAKNVIEAVLESWKKTLD